MIRTSRNLNVIAPALPPKLSFQTEGRAQARIFAGQATPVKSAEAREVQRFMRNNPPAGRIATRVIAGDLFVMRGQVYFRGITGPGQTDRLLKVGSLNSLTQPPKTA